MIKKLRVPTFFKHAMFGYNCVTLNIITSIYKVKFQLCSGFVPSYLVNHNYTVTAVTSGPWGSVDYF